MERIGLRPFNPAPDRHLRGFEVNQIYFSIFDRRAAYVRISSLPAEPSGSDTQFSARSRLKMKSIEWNRKRIEVVYDRVPESAINRSWLGISKMMAKKRKVSFVQWLMPEAEALSFACQSGLMRGYAGPVIAVMADQIATCTGQVMSGLRDGFTAEAEGAMDSIRSTFSVLSEPSRFWPEVSRLWSDMTDFFASLPGHVRSLVDGGLDWLLQLDLREQLRAICQVLGGLGATAIFDVLKIGGPTALVFKVLQVLGRLAKLAPFAKFVAAAKARGDAMAGYVQKVFADAIHSAGAGRLSDEEIGRLNKMARVCLAS